MKLFSIEFEEWIIADNEEKAIDCLINSILANPNLFREKCECIKIADEITKGTKK